MRRVLSIWIVGVCLAAAVPVAVARAPYSPPRTPWGDPDLQAIWSGDSAFGSTTAASRWASSGR